ncbi:MAG: DUF4105 domain-containing protein [Ginsengibacter sp.]
MYCRLLLISFLILPFSFLLSAQTDTSHLRISLLTCQPGDDLYSTFGHSALRVTDSSSNNDIVYNYGTFDFNEPGFYLKFIRGKLMYYLSTQDFDSFKNFYQEENRGITEQVLQLTLSEKKKIIRLVQQNLESENRFYKYDFTFDNCTTRLRDLIEKTADTTTFYGNVLKEKTRFRQLIYEYLNYNDKQWSKLGIDLFLGSKTDAVMSNRQVMFLPDYLLRTLNVTKIGSTPVVLSSQNLYVTSPKNNDQNFITHPEFIFSVFFILIVMLSFSKNLSIQKFIYNFDGFIFFITGLLGIVMLIMWFGTDHVMCRNNYNLLWAWPTHAVVAFFINRRKSTERIYFKLAVLINSVVLIVWFFLPQHMNISLIPVVMLLIFRSAMIGYNRRKYN